MKWLTITNWKNLQHYKDDRPPWIKFYGKLLTNLAFTSMPEAAQAQLVKLWLLASQMGHPLPLDRKRLAGLISTSGKFYLDEFINRGFLEVSEQENPIKTLEKSSEDSRESLEIFEENPREFLDESYSSRARERASAHSRQSSEDILTTPQHAGACARVDIKAQFPEFAALFDDAQQVVINAALTPLKQRAIDRLVRTIGMWCGGGGTSPFTPRADEIAQAFAEYDGDGNPIHFWEFVATVRARTQPRERSGKHPVGPNSSVAGAAFDNLCSAMHNTPGGWMHYMKTPEFSSLSPEIKAGIKAMGGMPVLANSNDFTIKRIRSQFIEGYTRSRAISA